MYNAGTFNKELGQLIKKKRIEKGLSQEELAKAIESNRMTVHKWENGQTKPQKSKIDKLCEILAVDYDRLMFLATERTAQSKVNDIQNYIVDENIRIPLYSRMPGFKPFADEGLMRFINISSYLLDPEAKYFALKCERPTINFSPGDIIIFESTKEHCDNSICCCIINGTICVIYGYIVDISGVECIGVLKRAIKEY